METTTEVAAHPARGERVRAMVIGLGTHGKRATGFASDAGVEIVAAIDPEFTGRDLGELLERTELRGTVVAAKFEDVVHDSALADIALLCLHAEPSALVDLEIQCVDAGMNVMTIVETVFDIEALPKDSREQLDRHARDAGVSVVATGSQDVTWAGLIRHACSQVRELCEVRLLLRIGVDGYPKSFLDTLGVGLTQSEFEESIALDTAETSITGATLLATARSMGFVVDQMEHVREPILIDEDIASETYERVLEAGLVVGDRDVTTLRTTQGVTFVAILETAAFEPGARDDLRLEVDAEPSLILEQRVTDPPVTVDATLINRIPDVLSARPGLLSALELRSASYYGTIE